MSPATEESRDQVERYRAEARAWKAVAALHATALALWVAFAVGAAGAADPETVRPSQGQPGVRRVSGEGPAGHDGDDRAMAPRMRYPSV